MWEATLLYVVWSRAGKYGHVLFIIFKKKDFLLFVYFLVQATSKPAALKIGEKTLKIEYYNAYPGGISAICNIASHKQDQGTHENYCEYTVHVHTLQYWHSQTKVQVPYTTCVHTWELQFTIIFLLNLTHQNNQQSLTFDWNFSPWSSQPTFCCFSLILFNSFQMHTRKYITSSCFQTQTQGKLIYCL